MSKYAYAVKVRKEGRYVWRADCPACGGWGASSSVRKALRRVHRWATSHAAACEPLHRLNWDARCRTCDGGALAELMPTCPDCGGRGWTP